MPRYVIGLIGNAGVGKDSFCEAIARVAPEGAIVWNLKFASRLKQITAELRECTVHDLDTAGPVKDKCRAFMQQFGQMAKDHFGPTVWIPHVADAIAACKTDDSIVRIVVVTDVRFQAELDFIDKIPSSRPLHIARAGSEDNPEIPSENAGQLAADNFIPTIWNDGSLEDLEEKARFTLKLLGILPADVESAEDGAAAP